MKSYVPNKLSAVCGYARLLFVDAPLSFSKKLAKVLSMLYKKIPRLNLSGKLLQFVRKALTAF